MQKIHDANKSIRKLEDAVSQECLSAFKNKPEQNPFFIDLSFPPLLLHITVSVTHRSCPAADQAVCAMKNKKRSDCQSMSLPS